MHPNSEKIREIKLGDLGSLTFDEKIILCLRLASLSPSVHNTQPWTVKLNADFCDIYVDKSISLPYSDQTRRHIFISLGCFVENLLLASESLGILSRYELFPQGGDKDCVARVFFSENKAAKSDHFWIKAMTVRKNIRGPFMESIPDEKIQMLKSTLVKDIEVDTFFVTEKDARERLAGLTAEGMKAAHSDKRFRREMSGWLINNYSKKTRGMPGFSMNMPGPISLILPKILGNFNLGSILSKLNYLSVNSAPLVCVFSASDEERGWLNVGRQAERIMLAAAENGLNTSVYVASVEIGDLYLKVKEVIRSKFRPQFLLCVGKMKKTPGWFTPRTDILSKLLK